MTVAKACNYSYFVSIKGEKYPFHFTLLTQTRPKKWSDRVEIKEKDAVWQNVSFNAIVISVRKSADELMVTLFNEKIVKGKDFVCLCDYKSERYADIAPLYVYPCRTRSTLLEKLGIKIYEKAHREDSDDES